MDSIFWTSVVHGLEVQQVALLYMEVILDNLLVRTFFTTDIAHCVVLTHSLYTYFHMWKCSLHSKTRPPYFYEPDEGFL